MPVILFSYISAFFIFLGLDLIWFSLTMNSLYKPKLGFLLLDKPNLAVAGSFYLLYAVGLVAFCIMPALEQANWFRAFWGAALFGLIAYATYDLTNLATLKNWSASLSVIDMLWGACASTIAAVASYFIVKHFS